MINLEDLITEAYDKHLELTRQREEKQRKEEEEKVRSLIALLKERIDKVINPDLQEALGIEFEASLHSDAVAKFRYKNADFCIKYGPYAGGQWGVLFGSSPHMDHVRSEYLVSTLLIEMGKIRADAVERLPESMPLEVAFETLCYCLNQAKDIFIHRNDFIHNPETFEEDLKTVVCLLQKLTDELASCIPE